MSRVCEICGISEDDHGWEFVYTKDGEPICEEHQEDGSLE